MGVFIKISSESLYSLIHVHLNFRMDFKVIIVLIITCFTISSQKEWIPKAYQPYTLSTTGCQCWWDLTRTTECACCKEGDTMQCGYPKHNYCYLKMSRGCPGIRNPARTLSEKGFQCFNTAERVKDCAWCVAGNYQCGKSRKVCGLQAKWCGGVPGDCRHIPHACDANARCVKVEEVNKYKSLYQCRCNKGYQGNGVQCFDKDGNMGIHPNEMVTVNLKMNSDYYLYPNKPDQLPNGAFMNHLMSEMSAVNGTCSNDQCEVTYNYVPDQV